VFVLFDTRQLHVRGFVYAEDAIADFVRGWIEPTPWRSTLSAAISRARDRSPRTARKRIMGLRTSVAGDDTALYNGLLLTLRDAAKGSGPQSRHRILERTR